jgi:hypothetical protein
MTNFALPGFIQDFPKGSPQDIALNARWNINAESWIQQAMPGAPSFFYDPSTTPIPPGTGSALVEWFAFPGRLAQYFSANPPVAPANPYNLNASQIFSLADTGTYRDQSGKTISFQQIPATLCPQADWKGELKPFGPYGPRGWLDEYCEWSVARDAAGNIMRVDFACENPEYWYSLWAVDPQRVAQLYQDTLNSGAPASRQITVTLNDLVLIDRQGKPVIDPQTSRPAYNPLNRWNSGPVAVRLGNQNAFTGGVMHLTSTPNTLQTELGLAGTATPQYASGNSDVQKLICCGQYGQEYRNSDPHIGYSVNRIVGGQGNIDGKPRLVCLANPVGLYIQTPDLSGLSFGPNIIVGRTVPANAKPTDIFQIIRGSVAPLDPVTGQPFPGDMLLHVAFQIPQSWLAMTPTLTLSDLQINGAAIVWGGQIASQMQIGLFARPLTTNANPPTVPCAGAPSPGAPLQIMYQVLWNGYYPIQEPTPPGGQPLSLASNTVIVPPWLPTNGAPLALVLTCNSPTPPNPVVAILNSAGTGPDPGISVAVAGSQTVTYAVPGNSYPGSYTALALSVRVAPGTAAGLRAIRVTNGGTLPTAVYIAGST